ncbi:ATP-dependent protease La [Cokeromyces recurvatus]|uniref:ATP-dependent protease La n=1 Tax=Cokeromyces recurvatus TaxID=90255 RepID=UPI00221E4B21|nr:ATP-dependent protease La [Cokeromyces recurvatus]KAI7908193.1 ATP-dependent protease La [Cokeromyces recurvatus]
MPTTSAEDNLIVVPLENKVLLPAVVLKINMRGRDAVALARQHLRSNEQRKPTYIACIPLINKDDQHQPVAAATADDDESTRNTKDEGFIRPEEKDRLFHFGCTARIIRIQRSGLGAFTMFIEGVSRFKVQSYSQQDRSPLYVKIKIAMDNDSDEKSDEMIRFKALVREFLVKMKELQMPANLIQQLNKLMDSVSPLLLADLLMSVIETSFDEKLIMLATTSLKERIEKASEWMTRQLHVLKISEQVHSSIEGKLSKKQREFYLRQQLEAIKKELGEKDGTHGEKEEDDLELLSNKLAAAELPEEASIIAQRELKRLKKLQPISSEYAVARNYLELLADLPWNKKSKDTIDIRQAKQKLEEDHFGLDHVKKRIIEYLSVIKIKGDLRAPIICFVGPPGVGKTSLGKSIASSLGREFHRISLGGVRDEAEMRGHRRTYVGAMPGLIIQGLRKCKVNNPLFLLDEIDKLVQSSHYGDPAAALLEVLDPEQNNSFTDHYLNLPFDLSNVLFIATANSVETIPEPLLDRMELITLNGYTFEEKLHIAKSHLLPKQLLVHGLDKGQVEMSDKVILKLAENYTRESGVRSLERTIASVVRAKCVELANFRELNKELEYSSIVSLSHIEEILGMPFYEKEVAERDPLPGVVTGLAYSGSGNGGILFIESTKMPGHGDLHLTGSLGDVIKESAHLALTWVKAHAYSLKVVPREGDNLVEKYDVHIHVPGGAVPKDGPSAGVTIVTSLVSLFSGYHVPTTTAMTGEISLRGQVLPVGGIKEKVVSAHRAGIQKIILPFRNKKDVDQDVPNKVKEDIKFVYTKNIWDVLEAALVINEKEKWNTRVYENRL